ncbi:glutamate--cysteine ligase [Kitasatospora sp. NPDC094015]|uniref:carboxylate-amine ligase n=1 Tax=Kitasatospora sp. NPDC094015 TaxID=3155205 RepID=UPI003327E067
MVIPRLSPPPTRAPALRFGVEEEFLLVDAATGAAVPRAEQVLTEAARTLGGRAQGEFCATQVEGCTRPVTSAAALREDLVGVRRVLGEAAALAGCLLIASGTPVLPSPHPLPLNGSGRYHRIFEHVGPVADQAGGEMCGCHVHVGDLTRAEALAVGNRLRRWLPALHALSANSPYCEGLDRGVASYRTVCFGRWPTVGPAPVLDEHGYERTMERLLGTGVLLDRRMVYWYCRPSEHLPTLEVRVADVNADLDTTVLIAVLVRALVAVLLQEVRSGTPDREVAPGLLRAAHRRAARVGLGGAWLDPGTGRARPAPVLLAELLRFAEPALDAHGDLPRARRLLTRTVTCGTGADRQRASFAQRGSLRDVVADLADLTARDAQGAGRPRTLTASR